MTTPIAFRDIVRQVAAAINTEARQAGMSPGQADDLMARVLERLGVEAQDITELRRSQVQGSVSTAD